MGLEDVVNDKTESNSKRSTSRSSGSDDDSEDSGPYKVVGSDPNKKVFSKEKWQETKAVIHEEMDMSVNEVLNSPPKKRFEILHEAVTFSKDELDEEESEHIKSQRCVVCGDACDNTGVEIDGEPVHIHHTVGQLEKELN